MAAAESQFPVRRGDGPHLVLYDGECGLCHGFVQFVLPRDREGHFHFAALQGPAAATHLARFGGVPNRLSTVYVVANYQGSDAACLVKARAALFVLKSLGWPWRVVSLFAVLPTVLLDVGYDLVARNRLRLFGRRDACLMPGAEYRRRFLDLPAASIGASKGAP